jgi:hypothetical protein
MEQDTEPEQSEERELIEKQRRNHGIAPLHGGVMGGLYRVLELRQLSAARRYTAKLTVLGQYGQGLVQCETVLGAAIQDQIERLQWSLWHGQVDKALGKIDDLETSIAPFRETYARFPRLVKALSGLRTYIVHNRHVIPNDGERYRNGEPIATGFVESTVNEVVSKRFCKKQQMQWSKEGAHLLLQTRVRTLNGELADIFKRWYPDLDMKAEETPIAA